MGINEDGSLDQSGGAFDDVQGQDSTYQFCFKDCVVSIWTKVEVAVDFPMRGVFVSLRPCSRPDPCFET